MDPSERYVYMFTAGGRRLLFVRNYGSGTQSRAQLVHDIDSGENLIRKVTVFRLVPTQDDSDPNWRPKPPREVRILHAIKHTFGPPEPDLTPYIPHCFGYEYIKSTSTDELGRHKYHSVSYWKLYNGGSLRSRWLKGDILPPAVAVARMIRQVLSTFHYICTAGKLPLYHNDPHFGNIWAHWTDGQPLPDFYLGDFADATFADSKIRDLSRGRDLLVPRSVDDLYRFGGGLDLLIDTLSEKRGHGGRVEALRRLAQGIDNLVLGWKHTADDPDVPPNLTGMIYWAEALERRFGPGGDEDETGTEEYVRYVTEERKAAKEVESEKGLVMVRDSVAAALDTSCAEGLRMVPMAIHAPWQLVRAETWVSIEADGVTHHRPNGDKGRDDGVDVSNTFDRPTMYDDGYLEAYSDGEVDDGPYTPLFQSYSHLEEEPELSEPDFDNHNLPSDLDGLFLDCEIGSGYQLGSSGKSQEPSSSGQRSSASSFTSGEKANPGSESEHSASPSPAPRGDETQGDAQPQEPADPFLAWMWAAPDDPLSFLKDPRGLRRPRVLRDLRSCSWASKDEPEFYVKDMFHPENLRHEDLVSFDWEQFYSRYEARFSRIRDAYDRRRARLIVEKQLYAKQVAEQPLPVPEHFEVKYRRCHMLVHGVRCRCNSWMDDVEAVLGRERTGRFMRGFKVANLSLEDPKLTISG